MTTITDKLAKINRYVCYFIRNDNMVCFKRQIGEKMEIYFGTDANGKNKVIFAVGKIMNPWW